MKSKKTKRSQGVKPLPKKYAPVPVFFDGIGKMMMESEEVDIFDKDSISGKTIILFDICEFQGTGDLKYETGNQAYQILIENDKGILGTVLIGGDFLSTTLSAIYKDRKKLLPCSIILIKKRAWSLRIPKE